MPVTPQQPAPTNDDDEPLPGWVVGRWKAWAAAALTGVAAAVSGHGWWAAALMVVAVAIVIGSELLRLRRAVLYRAPAPPPAPLPTPGGEGDGDGDIVLVKPRPRRSTRAG